MDICLLEVLPWVLKSVKLTINMDILNLIFKIKLRYFQNNISTIIR